MGNSQSLQSRSARKLALRGQRIWALAGYLPAVVWLVIFFAVPLGIIAISGFLTSGDYGGIERPWTFENYRRLIGFGILGFDPVFPQILARSGVLGFGTATLCLLAGLPLAFFIARLPGTYKTLGLMLVVIPFWTNLLIRTYAWQILLSPDGLFSQAAVFLGILDSGEALYPSLFAVYLCMVCDFLPLMVLPLYVSVEKIDWSIADAAADLGANRWKVFRHAIIPQIRAGMSAGLVLVFLPATGQFVIPDLLGGGKTLMLGNIIQQEFGSSLDWPFGSAMASVTLIIVLLGLMTVFRFTEKEKDIEAL